MQKLSSKPEGVQTGSFKRPPFDLRALRNHLRHHTDQQLDIATPFQWLAWHFLEHLVRPQDHTDTWGLGS